MSFLKPFRLAAGQRQQARPVGQLEIVDVAAVEGLLGRRVKLFDHAGDRSPRLVPAKPQTKTL